MFFLLSNLVISKMQSNIPRNFERIDNADGSTEWKFSALKFPVVAFPSNLYRFLHPLIGIAVLIFSLYLAIPQDGSILGGFAFLIVVGIIYNVVARLKETKVLKFTPGKGVEFEGKKVSLSDLDSFKRIDSPAKEFAAYSGLYIVARGSPLLVGAGKDKVIEGVFNDMVKFGNEEGA